MTNALLTATAWGFFGFAVAWVVTIGPQLVALGKSAREVLLPSAVLFYCCMLAALVLLPLPGPDTPRLEQTVQLVPFQWVADIDTELAKHGQPWSDVLATLTLRQVAFNVLLFAPLGFLAARRWRQSHARTTALGFGLSLVIETVQLTANFGTAHHVYRVFDIDDLIANTTGAALGSTVAIGVFAAFARQRTTTRLVRPAFAILPAAEPSTTDRDPQSGIGVNHYAKVRGVAAVLDRRGGHVIAGRQQLAFPDQHDLGRVSALRLRPSQVLAELVDGPVHRRDIAPEQRHELAYR